MCGLFGVAGFNSGNLDAARKALNALYHRGPDQWGEYYDQDIYMGHRRLSILDLSEQGRQPMTDSAERVVITVNGEIYNFEALKFELSDKYAFKSNSDSEVILYGYIEWGLEELLSKIDGMYAICIYDKSEKKIFLIRDRVGIKPLYYGNVDSRFVWGSELKALDGYYSNYGSLQKDNTACYDFLTYLYIPAPKTLYKDVFKLEAAHYLEFDLRTNCITDHKYWSLPVGGGKDSSEEAAEKVHQLLSDSVREQLVADVPISVFLSGGIDSSVVAALATKVDPDINSYTIGFTQAEHDESRYAKQVAKHLSIENHNKTLNADEIDLLFSKISTWYDEPFADTSCFPTFLVSKDARENSLVALSGDGGDELFGGYRWYKKYNFIKKYSFLKKIQGLFEIFGRVKYFKPYVEYSRLLSLGDLELYAKLLGGISRGDRAFYREYFSIPADYDDYWNFRRYYKQELDVYTRLQYLDFHTYLPDDILTKVDRVSMAVSLECRVPFLSKEIIEYAFSLPVNVRMPDGELKGLLKAAFKDSLPSNILHRGKRGFSIPKSAKKYLHSVDGFQMKSKQSYIYSKYFK